MCVTEMYCLGEVAAHIYLSLQCTTTWWHGIYSHVHVSTQIYLSLQYTATWWHAIYSHVHINTSTCHCIAQPLGGMEFTNMYT